MFIQQQTLNKYLLKYYIIMSWIKFKKQYFEQCSLEFCPLKIKELNQNLRTLISSLLYRFLY
jgi:hypothetical protein